MAHQNLNATSSSTVEAYGYSSSTSPGPGNLFVQFKSGKIYRYVVPLTVLNELDAAASKGKYINQMKKTYQGVPVSDDEVAACFVTATPIPTKSGKLSKATVKKVRIPKNIALKYPVLANFF